MVRVFGEPVLNNAFAFAGSFACVSSFGGDMKKAKKNNALRISILLLLSILVFASCGGGGGGGGTVTANNAKITVTFNSKALSSKTITVPQVVTSSVLSTIYSETGTQNGDGITKMTFTSVTKISWEFAGTTNTTLKTLVFDSAMTEIDSRAFYWCRDLSSVTYNSVPSLGTDAFWSDNTAKHIFNGGMPSTAQLKNMRSSYGSAMLPVMVTLKNSHGGDSSMLVYLNENPGKASIPNTGRAYVFNGYYNSGSQRVFDALGNPISGNDCIDSSGKWTSLDSTVLTANFTDNFYTVKFEAGEGASGTMADQIVANGEGVSLNKCTFSAPAGSTFKNWSVKDSGASYSYADMATINNSASEGSSEYIRVAKGQTITLVANWTAGYTRTYYRNLDATDTRILGTVTLGEDETAADIADPVYSGKTFAGWYSDSACTVLFDCNVAQNIDTSVYAKWNGINNYVINFDPVFEPVGPGKYSEGYVYTVGAEDDWGVVSYEALSPLQVNKADGPIKFSDRPILGSSGYAFLGWGTNKYAIEATFTASGGVVPDFYGTPVFESGLMGDGDTITLYAIWKYTGGDIGRTTYGQQDVQLRFPNEGRPDSAGGRCVYSTTGNSFPETLKLSFDLFGEYTSQVQNTISPQTIPLARYIDADGNSEYHLEGFYTQETGGFKVLEADGSFAGAEDLENGQDNGFIKKDTGGNILWIGGRGESDQLFTTLYSRWEKN